MNKRTMLLLAAMVLVALVMVGDQLGMLAVFEGGPSSHELSMDTIQKKIDKAEDIMDQGVLANDRLEAYEARSLPYQSEIARSEYQNWLTTLVEKNQLAQSAVEVAMPTIATVSDQGKQVETYSRYAFTLNAVARIEQITQFLFDFHQSGHLQKVQTLGLTPTSGGQLNLSIAGEALGLPGCDRAAELTSLAGNRLECQDVSEYFNIVRRNIFSSDVGATLKLVTLSSVTFDKSGLPEAWFKVGLKQENTKLQRGGRLSVSVHRVEVIDIQPRSVVVDLDGTIVDVRIGQTLHEAMSAPEVALK